jgi:type I restriction enzyme, S subunit
MDELPEGWKWKRLGDVCKKPEYGYTTSAKKEGDGPKFLRTTDITKDKFDWTKVPFCEQVPDDEERYQLHDGDLLISRAGSVGAAFVVKNPPRAVFASYLIRFQPKEDLNPFFADFFLKSNIFKNQLGGATSGTTLQGVNASNLAKIKIPLPPLSIQRQIVAVLERAEAVKRQRQEADALTGALLQSVFLEMFGDPMKNEEGWDFDQLDELCSVITDGEHVTPRRTDSGIFLLSARNIQNHYISTTDVDFIDEEEYTRLSKHLIPKNGDVLVSCSGSVGRVTRVNVDYKFQLVRSVALLRPIVEKVDPIYLEYSFETQFMENQISSCVHQSSQANLFQGMIRKLKIPLPPLALQQQFARVVQDVERIRERQVASGKEIEGLCEGLRARAFAGEIAA